MHFLPYLQQQITSEKVVPGIRNQSGNRSYHAFLDGLEDEQVRKQIKNIVATLVSQNLSKTDATGRVFTAFLSLQEQKLDLKACALIEIAVQ